MKDQLFVISTRNEAGEQLLSQETIAERLETIAKLIRSREYQLAGCGSSREGDLCLKDILVVKEKW